MARSPQIGHRTRILFLFCKLHYYLSFDSNDSNAKQNFERSEAFRQTKVIWHKALVMSDSLLLCEEYSYTIPVIGSFPLFSLSLLSISVSLCVRLSPEILFLSINYFQWYLSFDYNKALADDLQAMAHTSRSQRLQSLESDLLLLLCILFMLLSFVYLSQKWSRFANRVLIARRLASIEPSLGPLITNRTHFEAVFNTLKAKTRKWFSPNLFDANESMKRFDSFFLWKHSFKKYFDCISFSYFRLIDRLLLFNWKIAQNYWHKSPILDIQMLFIPIATTFDAKSAHRSSLSSLLSAIADPAKGQRRRPSLPSQCMADVRTGCRFAAIPAIMPTLHCSRNWLILTLLSTAVVTRIAIQCNPLWVLTRLGFGLNALNASHPRLLSHGFRDTTQILAQSRMSCSPALSCHSGSVRAVQLKHRQYPIWRSLFPIWWTPHPISCLLCEPCAHLCADLPGLTFQCIQVWLQ